MRETDCMFNELHSPNKNSYRTSRARTLTSVFDKFLEEILFGIVVEAPGQKLETMSSSPALEPNQLVDFGPAIHSQL